MKAGRFRRKEGRKNRKKEGRKKTQKEERKERREDGGGGWRIRKAGLEGRPF